MKSWFTPHWMLILSIFGHPHLLWDCTAVKLLQTVDADIFGSGLYRTVWTIQPTNCSFSIIVIPPRTSRPPSRPFAVAEDLVIGLVLHSTTMLGRLFLSSVVFRGFDSFRCLFLETWSAPAFITDMNGDAGLLRAAFVLPSGLLRCAGPILFLAL